MPFIRYILPTFVILMIAGGLSWAQYTNWPNGAAGTTTGALLLLDVVTSPPAYQNGQVQPGTQDINGNINVNCQIGCSASTDPANGSVGPGTAGTASKLGGAVFNSTPITLANLQQAALQADVNGYLNIHCQAGCAISSDPANGPVTPGTVATNSKLIGGQFNTVLPTVTNAQQVALQVDSNGRLIVNIGAGGAAGGTSSTFGAAFPSLGTAIGMSQGGNMVALTGTSGNLNINCAVGCAASTTAGSVTGGAAASQSNLAGGVFNTVLPSLTNGQQAAIQFDSSGRLIINLGTPLPAGSNVIGAVSGTTNVVTVTPTITAGAYTAGQCVGGLETFANAGRTSGPGTALVQSAVITDVSGQDANIDLVIFNANPTNTTVTDHTTCTIASADLGKIAGVIAVQDCHFLGTSAPGVCQSQQQALPISLGGGNTTAYVIAISRGTPTYTNTNNLAMRLSLLQD